VYPTIKLHCYKLDYKPVLEVGWYEPVWHTGTSLANLKPYCHFFLTPAIYFIATKRVFWAQNITYMRLQPGLCPRPHWGAYTSSTDPIAGWGGEGRKGKVRAMGRGGKGKSVEENRSIPVLLFRTSSPDHNYS